MTDKEPSCLNNGVAVKRFGCLVGDSAPMRRVYELIEKAAGVDMPLLVLGETGAGKELVAREVHDRSARAGGPFVAVNTGAISPELVGSELFGHKKGAFTGATDEKVGRFLEGNGGSVFLDEISTMDDQTQITLLRVLERRTFRPIGAKRDETSDFRLIAASNDALDGMVEEGRFRSDLLYRLGVLCIQVPALRERAADIPMLCQTFVEMVNADHGFAIEGVKTEALDRLVHYPWPGNIRELKNVMAQAAVLTESGMIDVTHLPARIGRPGQGGTSPDEDCIADLPTHHSAAEAEPSEARGAAAGLGTERGIFIPFGATLEHVQKEYALATLENCGQNKTRAAQALGISRKTLYDRLERWGVSKPK